MTDPLTSRSCSSGTTEPADRSLEQFRQVQAAAGLVPGGADRQLEGARSIPPGIVHGHRLHQA